MNDYGNSFLLAPFREFYREVIRLKRVVRAGTWVTTPHELIAEGETDDIKTDTGIWVYFPDSIEASVGDEALELRDSDWDALAGAPPGWELPGRKAAAPPAALEYTEQAPAEHIRISTLVWQRLLTLFERQSLNAWRYGGTHGAEFYKEAQYVMVALADEIFLHMEWEGKRAWVSNLLETKIFQTHVAGELIFKKIERLLHDRDPVHKDLAAVYLMALSLGFQGKYRGTPDRGQIALYRQQLFAFIFRREPDLESETKHIFPEAYFHTLREETKKKLPHPRVWIGVLCVVILVYLAATHLFWTDLTARLDNVNNRIAEIVKRLDAKP
jgi:type VI secretion system protein ImpK